MRRGAFLGRARREESWPAYVHHGYPARSGTASTKLEKVAVLELNPQSYNSFPAAYGQAKASAHQEDAT